MAQINEKLYYSISEVSKITKIEAYTLRYWEKEFPKLKPKKSKKGQRIYTKKDLELISIIKELLHNKKYTIKGAREVLKGYSYGKTLEDLLGIKNAEEKKDFPDKTIHIKKELLEIKKLLKDMLNEY